MNTLNIFAITSSQPKFWGRKRTKILHTIHQVLSINGYIKQKELDKIIHELKGNNEYLSRKSLKQLAQILIILKDQHDVDTIIPALPISVPRPSVLPVRAAEFSWLDGIYSLRRFFWHEWLQGSRSTKYSPISHETALFSFAFCLAVDASLHAIQIANAISQLRFKDIINNGQSIKLRVHPKDKFNRYCTFHLPTTCQLFMFNISANMTDTSPETHVFFPDLEPKFKKRKARINNILRSTYNDLTKLHHTQNTLPTPPTWQDFTRVSHLISFNLGIEPFIISALRRYPLPVSHPIESSLSILQKNKKHQSIPVDLLFHHKIHASNTTPHLISTRASTDESGIQTIEDWSGASKTILRQLVNKLESTAEGKINSTLRIQDACDKIQLALNQADLIAPPTSALHLALNWIKSHIIKRGSLTTSTIKTYFSKAFYNSLLTFGDSSDLAQWDTEDHELAIEAALSRPRITESYKKDIIAVLKMVYKYANSHEYSENVDIKFTASEWTGSSVRSEILGLHQFDSFIQLMLKSKDREMDTIAVSAILSFYGGLRAGETTRLTLNDIIAIDGEIYIEIHKGKTPAARRRIPLHMLAPTHICTIVAKYYQMRLDEFQNKTNSQKQLILRNIPLFGPSKSRERFTRKSIIDVTISKLKEHFGNDISYHSLRHSFSSWLLIRWHANRYPDFCNSLTEGRHSIFNDENQMRLREFFTNDSNQIPHHNASDLIKLSKLMGHLGQETLFSTYIHTFDAIHDHAMARVSNTQGVEKLSGKNISFIVPKMKSRHSHQKLPGRTINDICEYLKINTSMSV